MNALEKILDKIEERMVRNVMKPEEYKVGMKSWYGAEI